jgi:hypothetical protein
MTVATSSPARGVARQARHFGRFVAQRLQGDAGFGDGIVGDRAAAGADAGTESVDAVAQFDDEALGGLLADAGDARQRGDVRPGPCARTPRR